MLVDRAFGLQTVEVSSNPPKSNFSFYFVIVLCTTYFIFVTFDFFSSDFDRIVWEGGTFSYYKITGGLAHARPNPNDRVDCCCP